MQDTPAGRRAARADGPRSSQPKRRTFTAAYKLAMIEKYDAATEPGTKGALNLSQLWIATVYAVSILVGISLILWLALCADESKYSSRSGWLGLTPVTTVGLAVDIVAGVVAYFAGGAVHPS